MKAATSPTTMGSRAEATAEATFRPQLPVPERRLRALCDPDSFNALRQEVRSGALGERARPGDGVVAGAGQVNDRPVFCYAQDAAFLGGSLGKAQAESIVRVLGLAGSRRAPVVSFHDSGGARMQEGLGALAGYGEIFSSNVALSGRVPQISVISGVSAGGASYSPALTDFVVMTKRSSMFLTGPAIVKEVLGESVSFEELGGHGVHSRNGVCHLVADDDTHAVGWFATCSPTCRRALGNGRRNCRRGSRSAATRARRSRRAAARSTTCATSCAAWSTAARCSRYRPAGRRTS